MEQYDVIIVGSGLGGLASAIILGKEGKKVLVLEKNNQFGGNLQTFARNKTIFDTGVHYLGALGEGQNLYKYFKYLGIYDGLELIQMNKDGFDLVSFDNDSVEYPHAQGYDNFVKQLLVHFPEEEETLIRYCSKLKEICHSFPLYNLEVNGGYDLEVLSINAKEYLDTLTSNDKLKAVLMGSTYLYAGIASKSPLYVHALSVNSYIESAWRIVKGGSQITRQVLKELKKYNVTFLKHKEVTEFVVQEKKLIAVKTKDGETYFGENFISNIELKSTLKMVQEGNFRKSFINRVNTLEPVISSFSLYLVFKPETFKYKNHNYYHLSSWDSVWSAQFYNDASWPESYMGSMGLKNPNDEYAESMTFMTYMRYEDVKQWENTVNTIVDKAERGASYEAFKNNRIQRFIDVIEKRFPGIKDCIAAAYASTPLSYRDYIGGQNGNMYGYVKDSHNPMLTFISPKSKIENLYFTGQSVNMHGVLGVTIGAVATCAEMLDKKYLLDKINKELEEKSFK